jgi:hypothetical protein
VGITGIPPSAYPGWKIIHTTPPTVAIFNDQGGMVDKYDIQFRVIAEAGGPVKVFGPCSSACTLVVAHVPKDRLCFGEDASLNFHQARYTTNNAIAPEITKWMISRYPEEIRNWIAAQGGVERMPAPYHYEYWMLRPRELWKMGYGKCLDLSIPQPVSGR